MSNGLVSPVPNSGESGPKGKTKDEHWNYTLRKLGLGITEVELTDEHKQDCLDDTERWFVERVGFRTHVQLQLVPGQSDYILPADIAYVYRVHLPMFQLPTLDPDSFGFTYFTALFGAWTSPHQAPMPYSDLVQRLQYLETIGRIFTTDRDFDWHPHHRRLNIMPAPRGGGLGTMIGLALLDVGMACVLTEVLDPQGHDFFRRKLLIEAKRTLGNIRTIYDSFPNVGGDRAMNGDQLLQQAEQEEEKLERDALNWVRATPMITG